MSGHNKWSKIKHKKASTDAQKSKQFSKISKLITTEMKLSSGDKNSFGVKKIIEQAKAVNMPNQNIEKALEKGLKNNTKNKDSVLYEFYGPGGVALIIEGLTDNKNRTISEIKRVLSNYGFELAKPGSVLWVFNKTETNYNPSSFIALSKESKDVLYNIIAELEENEDVENLHHNAE